MADEMTTCFCSELYLLYSLFQRQYSSCSGEIPHIRPAGFWAMSENCSSDAIVDNLFLYSLQIGNES